jgi:hypothetical protein
MRIQRRDLLSSFNSKSQVFLLRFKRRTMEREKKRWSRRELKGITRQAMRMTDKMNDGQ